MATTPVFLPGKFHVQRSLVGYSPQGHKESDMTEHGFDEQHKLNHCCLQREPVKQVGGASLGFRINLKQQKSNLIGLKQFNCIRLIQLDQNNAMPLGIVENNRAISQQLMEMNLQSAVQEKEKKTESYQNHHQSCHHHRPRGCASGLWLPLPRYSNRLCTVGIKEISLKYFDCSLKHTQ